MIGVNRHIVVPWTFHGGSGMFAKIILAGLLTIIVLVIASRPVWSFETTPVTAHGADAGVSAFSTSLPDTADSCLPLLNAVQIDPSISAMDGDRHSAGQAAALGLMFGLRIALGPKELTRTGRPQRNAVTAGFWSPSDGNGAKALAIAEYRRCRNEQVLQALTQY